jgi:hypothetical protein
MGAPTSLEDAVMSHNVHPYVIFFKNFRMVQHPLVQCHTSCVCLCIVCISLALDFITCFCSHLLPPWSGVPLHGCVGIASARGCMLHQCRRECSHCGAIVCRQGPIQAAPAHCTWDIPCRGAGQEALGPSGRQPDKAKHGHHEDAARLRCQLS